MNRQSRRRFDRQLRRANKKPRREKRTGPSPIVDNETWWQSLSNKRRAKLEAAFQEMSE